MSDQPPRVTTKLFVAKLPDTVRKIDLQKLCEKYGKVVECDFVKRYAFVHFSTPEEAAEAVRNLDNTVFMGSKITVQFSNSPVRTKPGMGQSSACYRCGKFGHWSRHCPTAPASQKDATHRWPDRHKTFRQAPYSRDPQLHREPPPMFMDRSRDPYCYDDPYTRQVPLPSVSVPPAASMVNDTYQIDPYTRPPPEYYHIPTIQSFRPR